MRQVPEIEIKNRFEFDNPWWESNEVDERFRQWPRRAYFDGFFTLVTERRVQRAVVLMGPRRIGKTVMIQQAVQELIVRKVDPKKILYVSVDTPLYTGLTLEKLLAQFKAIHGHPRKAELYVFIDEIQYHPQWEVHLKSLVDSYPEIRFVASGSAAAALKIKSQESGAGRFTEFILPSLTFGEFLRFRDLENIFEEGDIFETTIEKLNEAFIDYINFGGFPEAVLEEKVRQEMSRYVANDIIDKVLLRDLPSLYGISDTQELNRLFTTLAYNTGDEISLDDLSNSSNVSKNTIRRYIEYLEAAFLIKRIFRIDRNAKRFKKQSTFKVYLTNPCLRAALFGAVDSTNEAMGRLVETVIVSHCTQNYAVQNLFYARWKTGEVDLVELEPLSQKPILAFEIKWSDRAVTHPNEELRGLLDFCKKNKSNFKPIVSTKTQSKEQYINGIQINFWPASLVSYWISKDLIESPLKTGFHPLSRECFYPVSTG